MNYSAIKAATKIGAITAKRARTGRYTRGQLKRLANLVAAINKRHNAQGNPVHMRALESKRYILRELIKS